MPVNRIASFFTMPASAMYFQVVADLGAGEQSFDFADCRNAVMAWTALTDFCERADRDLPDIYRIRDEVRGEFDPNENKDEWAR